MDARGVVKHSMKKSHFYWEITIIGLMLT